ncbi:hypothetical protein RRG08_031183 [Elysia crispata]|uniref:Uncharacterized protein n=1 Tax=Elysia crispata TaxID=231223 RepID=A0AAE0ZFK0_9GAST|nr:hypothetical protein RRG08_031183 [Elysia crispata]
MRGPQDSHFEEQDDDAWYLRILGEQLLPFPEFCVYRSGFLVSSFYRFPSSVCIVQDSWILGEQLLPFPEFCVYRSGFLVSSFYRFPSSVCIVQDSWILGEQLLPFPEFCVYRSGFLVSSFYRFPSSVCIVQDSWILGEQLLPFPEFCVYRSGFLVSSFYRFPSSARSNVSCSQPGTQQVTRRPVDQSLLQQVRIARILPRPPQINLRLPQTSATALPLEHRGEKQQRSEMRVTTVDVGENLCDSVTEYSRLKCLSGGEDVGR